MELQDFRAELSLKALEFERALDAGMPQSELVKIYRELKELQYQCLMCEMQGRESASNQIIEWKNGDHSMFVKKLK